MIPHHDLSGAKTLSKVASRALTPQQSRLRVALLFIAAELENLADVIERNIRDRAKKLVAKDLHLSEEGLEDVRFPHCFR